MKTYFMTKIKDYLPQYFYNLLLFVILVVVVCVRFRYLSIPLERDEGEYAYIGQLLLKGVSPFMNAYSMKLPGVGILYAIFMIVFGQTIQAVHLALLVSNTLSIIFIFIIAKRLLDKRAALVSCCTFSILSLNYSIDGICAHATHFVVLFTLTGFVLMFNYLDHRKFYLVFFSGFSFGLAFLMKQHGIMFVIFALLYLGRQTWERRGQEKNNFGAGCMLFLTGAVIPYVLIVLWIIRTGVFDQFWLWTIKYAQEYATGQPLLLGISNFFEQLYYGIVPEQPMLWLLGIVGGILLGSKYGRCNDKVFLGGLTLCSLLAISPGLFFRQHYFIMLLPAISILVGMVINSMPFLPWISTRGKSQHLVPSLLIVASFLFGINHDRAYLFTQTPLETCRWLYSPNPFPEAVQIGNYLKEHTLPDDRIAILGSEPEIYFYADRMSATGHIYMYGLMENQPYAEFMQKQMIHEIETTRPSFIVVVNVRESWLPTETSVLSVVKWGQSYLHDLYFPVGAIDIIDDNTTRYNWDDNAVGYAPISKNVVMVYKRKKGL